MIRVILVCATAALAACAGQQAAPDYAASADRLDRGRAKIAPPLGATTYTLDRSRLLDQPGGENRSSGKFGIGSIHAGLHRQGYFDGI
jgi:hypothetical protein